MYLGNAAAELPVKFQNDQKNLNLNLVTSGLYENKGLGVHQVQANERW